MAVYATRRPQLIQVRRDFNLGDAAQSLPSATNTIVQFARGERWGQGWSWASGANTRAVYDGFERTVDVRVRPSVTFRPTGTNGSNAKFILQVLKNGGAGGTATVFAQRLVAGDQQVEGSDGFFEAVPGDYFEMRCNQSFGQPYEITFATLYLAETGFSRDVVESL